MLNAKPQAFSLQAGWVGCYFCRSDGVQRGQRGYSVHMLGECIRGKAS
jgi:hypothetical protein